MAAEDPTRRSLALVLASPMLIVAELAWRWAYAAGAIGIVLYYSSIVRDAISLSAADQSALLSGDLLQLISTGTRVLAGALPFFVQAAVSALPKIALLWLFCATLGRAPIVHHIVSLTAAAPVKSGRVYWTAMASVHSVRVVLFLIVISSYIAAGRLAAAVMGDLQSPRLFSAFVVFFFTFGLGLSAWALANFVAALAPLFIAARGRSALDSLADALRFSMLNRGLFFTSSATNAMLRTVFSVVITGAGILLLPLSRYAPTAAIIVLAALLTVLYCLGSDILLLARTVAYALITLGEPAATPSPANPTLETPLYSAPPDLRS